MPALTATGFSVIDTYNIIREDMQTLETDFEEEFDSLEQQQGIPQFSFSSSTTSLPTQTAGNVQQIAPFSSPPTSSPSPAPSSYSSPSPLSPCPPAAPQTLGEGQLSEEQIQSFLDMEMSASFLEELMGQPKPPTPVSVQPAPLPALRQSQSTISSTYVAEAAAAGCTVVQAAEVRDQQLLLDMDVVDLCDLDRHSFYDEASVDAKVQDAGCGFTDWVAELGVSEVGRRDQVQPLPASPPTLTELGPVAGSEQEDLLSALDSIRRDIVQDCKQLSISSNPNQWSAQDSQSWVTYMLDKFQRSDDCSASLAVTGSDLCRKSEKELLWVSPSSGSFLRQQLELWMAVADLPALTPKPQHQQQQPSLVSLTPALDVQLTPQSGATPAHLPPSVSPAPSTDSACSSASSLSSSLSPSSDSEMFWCPESSEEELSQDSNASLTPSERPRSTISKSSSTTSSKQHAGRPGKQIRLWEFLKELLEDNDPSMKWLDRARGIFKIEDSNRVARLWGIRKNHPAMNYDKLSRSVRQYYKKGIIKKTVQTRRLVYQFCERYL